MADQRHISVYLRVESLAELVALSGRLHISRSAVIATAISKLHRAEGLEERRARKANGAKPKSEALVAEGPEEKRASKANGVSEAPLAEEKKRARKVNGAKPKTGVSRASPKPRVRSARG